MTDPISSAGSFEAFPSPPPSDPGSQSGGRSKWSNQTRALVASASALTLLAVGAAVADSRGVFDGPAQRHYYSVGDETMRACVGTPIGTPVFTPHEPAPELHRFDPYPPELGGNLTEMQPLQMGRSYTFPANAEGATRASLIDTNADNAPDCGRLDVLDPKGEVTNSVWLNAGDRTVYVKSGEEKPHALLRFTDGQADNLASGSIGEAPPVSRQAIPMAGGELSLQVDSRDFVPATAGDPNDSALLTFMRGTGSTRQTTVLAADATDNTVHEALWTGEVAGVNGMPDERLVTTLSPSLGARVEYPMG